MRSAKPRAVIIANDAAAALEPLCGVSTLERLLRILRRIGFDGATILAAVPEQIRAAIEPPSWARRGLRVEVLPITTAQDDRPALRIPAELYCDARLLRALSECEATTELIDSTPPENVKPLLARCGFIGSAISSGAVLMHGGEREFLDAADQPTYITAMRRSIRPVFFPAPPANLRKVAEQIILDTGQNGTLDIPAILQSPVEDFVMRWLWRTAITPNQITIFGCFVALAATALFATGHLWWGMLPALAIGVIDGLDGKQARVKIETSETGEWEHILDFFVETSWWAALAFWFDGSAQLQHAWLWFAAIMLAEGVDQLAKRTAKIRTGRLLDDLTPFDRFVRRIGARRDIYIWSLAIGLALGIAAQTYVFCAIWGVLTAAIHALRAAMVRR